MRKLPAGIQSFDMIRKNGYAYIDRTVYIRKPVNYPNLTLCV